LARAVEGDVVVHCAALETAATGLTRERYAVAGAQQRVLVDQQQVAPPDSRFQRQVLRGVAGKLPRTARRYSDACQMDFHRRP
jgi:hypothetical protein